MTSQSTRDRLELVRSVIFHDARFLSLVVLGASLVIRDPTPASPNKTKSGLATPLNLSILRTVETPPSGLRSALRENADGMNAVDGLVAAAIAEAKLPGCVVTVGRSDRVLFQKAYGMRQVDPERKPMTIDTVFDLASLTKPIATATAIMVLVDRGMVGLDEPVVRYVPEFWQKDKRSITVRHLLTHVSGLPAETILEDYKHGRTEALRRIAITLPLAAPGTRFIYSDIGFLVLEDVITRVTGKDLATFTAEAIFRPLRMFDTGFLPPPTLRERIAPTEYRDAALISGEVHDPRAHRLGGVAGHAGLFSTASDLVRYAQALLKEGELDGVRFLSRESTRAMMAPHDVPGGIRALGWDVHTSFSANRGETLSRRAVGHGGYTGTALWIDPQLDLFVLFLSNRVHPDGKGAVNQLAGRIGTLAGATFGRKAPPVEAVAFTGGPPWQVQVGVDVLRSEQFSRLRGARVGLITNTSGRASDGTRTADLLKQAEGVTLVALFAPEHGLEADREQKIKDGNDESTRLPVYSLYGDNFAPTEEMLAGIDTLVFDIQDVGARFYTYASTMHRTLRVAAERGLRLVVLDRPNPLDGIDVSGPMPAMGTTSFVNHHPLPIRHGMTLGELAEMINAEEHLGARLEIVRMRGWTRTAYFDQTGLAWTPPSPNLRSVTQTVLYPGVALVEGTNVSVGRGTETPFEIVGAPWMDHRLASVMNAQLLPGVSFSPARFTPTASIYAGKPCQGIRLELTDRTLFEPVRTGIVLARTLAELYPGAWNPTRLNQIIAHQQVTDAILKRQPLHEIESLWAADLASFLMRRKKYLLYGDDIPG